MRSFFNCLFFLALVLGLATNARAETFSHRPFDQILKRFVRRGQVDYQGIKNEGQTELRAYLKAIAGARCERLTPQARLAFYLNAYNALVIGAVVQRLPAIRNVSQVKGFFDRTQHGLCGKKMTLNKLENELIRREFKDPRIHFALVCAARSCPPLRAAAFDQATLNDVLERLAQNFINSWQGVRLKGDQLLISQLFNWYAGDFSQKAGSVGRYLARYHRRHARQLAAATTLLYIPYDWSLNQQ